MVSVRSLARVVAFSGLLVATAFALDNSNNNNNDNADHLSHADFVDRVDMGLDEAFLQPVKGSNARADRRLQEETPPPTPVSTLDDVSEGATPAPSPAGTSDDGGKFTMSPTGVESQSTDSPTPAPSEPSDISGVWRPLPSLVVSAAAVAVAAVSGAVVMV